MNWINSLFFLYLLSFLLPGCSSEPGEKGGSEISRATSPNILFAISDDQSYPHCSAYGSRFVQTPHFDKVAGEGVLFTNAFVAAPQCSPSRASVLTGRNIWQLEEAGTHSSLFPKKFSVFTDALEAAGYELGYTGKPWGPGNWKDAGWLRNPVGPEYNEINFDKEEVPYAGIRNLNYAANFKAFLSKKPKDKPFFFWYGASEPHREFEPGSGRKAGKQLEEVLLPDFLPDDSLIRSDMLDYAVEIEWFDKHLGEMMKMLEETGELDNTIVVVTSDNGMAFPSAKANLMEFGTHVPLAISGPVIPYKGRVVDDLVSMIDLAPTFIEIGQAASYEGITGKSLLPILQSEKSGVVDPARETVLTGRERHTHARPDNLGYPARAIRTKDFLYIKNFKPDLWPAGDPEADVEGDGTEGGKYRSMTQGFHDIDASPSKTFMLEHATKYPAFFQRAMGKRPAEELYAIGKDPACMENLAKKTEYDAVRRELKSKLEAALLSQGDPRMLGNGDVFDSYPRFAGMRNFPGFKEQGKYNPKYAPDATIK